MGSSSPRLVIPAEAGIQYFQLLYSSAYAGNHGLGRGGKRNSGRESLKRRIYHASADFAHRRMTHRSLGVGGYGFWGPQACPWGSMQRRSYVLLILWIPAFAGMTLTGHQFFSMLFKYFNQLHNPVCKNSGNSSNQNGGLHQNSGSPHWGSVTC